uniref:Ig-like domain-containing protein n=1 Tax=Cyanoderma ruficeps TaxID=181631 RepID=A0A8C3XBL3_9PASS
MINSVLTPSSTLMIMLRGTSAVLRGTQALEQSPLYANPEPGQSVNISCVLKSSPEDEEFYLLRTQVQPGGVLSVSHVNKSEVSPAFGNRLEYSKERNRIVITLHNLQEEDSDNYICAQQVKGSPLLSAGGTMVLVKGTTLLLKQPLCFHLPRTTRGEFRPCHNPAGRKRKKGQNKVANTSQCAICQF